MPVSPQDFDLYSRMTGVPVPSNPLSRMQMAPDVYKFTKDFAKKPNILEKSGNLLKNIGKTIGMGMAGAAASPAFVEPPQTTAENYDQTKVPNQTGGSQIAKVTDLGAEIADSTTVSEVLSQNEESRPALEGVPALPGSEPIGLLESQADRFRRQAVTEKADSFLDTNRPGIDPILLAAIKRSRDAEPLEGFKGQLPSYLGDHPDLAGGETPNPSLNINSAATPITPPTPSTLVSSGTNTSATTNLSEAMRDALDSLAKGRADLSPEQRFEMAQKLVSPNELAGKDQATFEALQAGIPKEEQIAAAERVKAKTRQKQKELGILAEDDVVNASTPSTPATPTTLGVRDKVEAFKKKIMPDKPSSFVESMSLDTSPNKAPTATFNLYQKDGSTKPFTYGISSPMAVSLDEMVKDESLPEESFGQIMNLLKKSIKDDSGMGFYVNQ